MSQNNFILPTYIGAVKLSDSSGELYVNDEPIGGGGSGNIFDREEYLRDLKQIANENFTGTFYKEYKICGMDYVTASSTRGFSYIPGADPDPLNTESLAYRMGEAQTVSICYDIKYTTASDESSFTTFFAESSIIFEADPETGDMNLVFNVNNIDSDDFIIFGTVYLWANIPAE